MPSIKKIVHYLASVLLILVSVGLLGFGMAVRWSTSYVSCKSPASGSFNGSAEIRLTLFEGVMVRDSCPLFGSLDRFEVIPTLFETGGAPGVLHILVVILLALCLLFSAMSILIALFNSISNPYQTYLGPIGFYTTSSISVCLSVLVLILFAVNVNVTGMAEDLVGKFSATEVQLKDSYSVMKVGYYMVIPYIVLNLGAIALIYMYTHAAYTQRKQQQRPTEVAPKDIMMF
ncbi:unnamed protein product [Ophioblennius macclurei]